MITVPNGFASDIIQREGDAGRQWINKLPELVAELVERWRLRLDGPIHHGMLAIIIEAHRGAMLCVLKVSWQNDATTLEATALQLWNGRGAVQLLEAEPALGALLLERLDARRTLGTLAIGAAVPIAGRLLRRLAIPASAGIPTLHARMARLPGWLYEQWEHVGRPMQQTIVERACDLVPALDARSHHDLVNYDLHWDNVLAGTREPWLAVDPMVLAGDVAFGLAPLLWWRLEDIEADGGLGRHAPALAEATEVERGRACGWTLVRSVDYWLWGLEHGLTIDPPRCARIVDWLLAQTIQL